ncbi:forkhead box protein B1 [Platysternon megacephalum]|uniref:Forkhead box protein B1 n=1 Tax=Platysternon megacephalum TaxID=55544 RepID=A0A4D9ECS5_9SAUR|nr:forkhead box protein B1 [Platysternon megacephalum]
MGPGSHPHNCLTLQSPNPDIIHLLKQEASENGCAQIHLGQAQLSVTRAKDKTARIDCEASGIQNFGSAVIHWYRHRPGEAPQRILYISPKKVEFDKGNENKFNCEKKPDQPISTLTVNEIAPKDGATYYCAYWDLTVLESHRQPVQKPHSEY